MEGLSVQNPEYTFWGTYGVKGAKDEIRYILQWAISCGQGASLIGNVFLRDSTALNGIHPQNIEAGGLRGRGRFR